MYRFLSSFRFLAGFNAACGLITICQGQPLSLFGLINLGAAAFCWHMDKKEDNE